MTQIALITSLAHAVASGLAQDSFYDLEKTSNGDRMTADQMREAVFSYGRRLVAPPSDFAGMIDIIRIDRSSVPAGPVVVPLWTEEGRSDRSLEMTALIPPNEPPRISIDDIHVR